MGYARSYYSYLTYYIAFYYLSGFRKFAKNPQNFPSYFSAKMLLNDAAI